MAKALKGTRTHDNLKNAFAGESQANRRYLYFARRADIEGYPDVGGLFRDTSEAETGHAFGHLDFLKEAGDPVTGLPIGSTEQNLKSAIDGHDGDITALSIEEDRRTVDLCFGCKLCYPLCPYTPPHRWAVDFPLLMQQARVARADREGVAFRDRVLGNAELLGRIGSAVPAVSNWVNQNRAVRWAME